MNDAVARRLEELQAAGAFALPGVAPGEARPVLDAAGQLHAWWAPFVRDGRLLAFVLLTPTLELQRFSLLAGGRPEAAPVAVDWLDEAKIAARAMAQAGDGARAGVPVLSFDGVPDRLAWRVPIEWPDGSRTHCFVAGESVWSAG